MSDSIFEIDYSSCRDFEREIKSYINYFEDIQDLISDVETNISNATALNGIWSKENLNNNISNLKSAIKKEVCRYSNFKSGFNEFHSPIESIDSNLEMMIENQLKFVDDNRDYNMYITLLQFNQADEAQEQLYNTLIDQGLAKEEATKVSLLFNPQTKSLINKLIGLDESELKKEIKKIKDKVVKSPEEVLLIDILSMDKNSARVDVLNQVNSIIASGSVSSWLNSKYVGKNINKFNLDIKAIDGQINALTRKISKSQLGKTKVNIMKGQLEDLKNIRATKISKSTRLGEVTNTVGKWTGRIAVACQVAEISSEQYENYIKNGDELDDVAAAVGIDVGGIILSGIAGSKISGAIGTTIGGPIGSIIGVVVGFLLGGVAGVIYNVIVDPILTDIYDNIVEPGVDWIEDKINDLGDWWDTLCW